MSWKAGSSTAFPLSSRSLRGGLGELVAKHFADDCLQTIFSEAATTPLPLGPQQVELARGHCGGRSSQEGLVLSSYQPACFQQTLTSRP